MKKLLLMTCAAAAYAAHATPPEIGNVQFKQDENRLVTISYTLGGADAIVMMDVLTNGVSIGKALYANAAGDVNVRGDCRWRPASPVRPAHSRAERPQGGDTIWSHQ